jgi:hypothetical protein
VSIIFDSDPKAPSVDFILSRTSDEKTLIIFDSIANPDGNRSTAFMKPHLTAKQYYSRISGLMDAGLIKRCKGKYSLTLFGTVVYFSLMTICNTIDSHPKPRTVNRSKY